MFATHPETDWPGGNVPRKTNPHEQIDGCTGIAAKVA